MVIQGVELMLDRFDQDISNRYKLIDYRETDFQKTIIHFSSAYFIQISIPVMSGKYLDIAKFSIIREYPLYGYIQLHD